VKVYPRLTRIARQLNVAVVRLASGLIAATWLLLAQSPDTLYRQGRQAEKKGEFAKAYLYYAQAAAAEPDRRDYWARVQSLQTKALVESPIAPRPATDKDVEESGTDLAGTISDAEMKEARRPLPPSELQAAPGLKSFDLKGDATTLFLEVAKAFGLDAVFDGDYQPQKDLRYRVAEADYRGALRALEAATGSFLVPLGPKLFFVAKDTPQKRTEAEPTVALLVPIPEPVSVQDAQEMARSVQQAMEIQRFVIDSARRLVYLKDRVSKARPAQRLFEQLLRHRPQVVVEVELLDLNS